MTEHPAKFSSAVVQRLGRQIYEKAIAVRPDEDLLLCDPFAGVGRIHEFDGWCDRLTTVGIELEPEWAAADPRTIQGDARDLPFEDGDIDVIATSPTYGNRMADHHKAHDRCRACDGMGWTEWVDFNRCKKCDGSGHSKRITYRHQLGRALTEGNSGAMQWGPAYRKLHVQAWREARRVLAPGGLLLLNIGDHIRKGEVVPVTDWHKDVLERLGFVLIDSQQVSTPGMRMGANRDKRVGFEWVLAFRRPG